MDLFYVALSGSRSGQPFALRTSAAPSLALDDLLPNTTYWLRWRAHPRAATAKGRNIGWDWAQFTPPFACTTATLRAGAPFAVRRAGALAEDSIGLTWSWEGMPSSIAADEPLFEVLVGRLPSGKAATGTNSRAHPVPAPATVPLSTFVLVTKGLGAHLTALKPGSLYEVVVRVRGGASSDPIRLRTAAAGYARGAVRYTTMTRVSEFTNDVDFLDGHDSATSPALGPLLWSLGTWTSSTRGFAHYGNCARH